MPKELTSMKSYWNENVGYEVDEPHRGHRYAAIALKMVLPIAKSHAMDHLLVSCNEDNVASTKTIERCGGKLLEIHIRPKIGFITGPAFL